MKNKIVWIVAFIATGSLLVFQVVSLYYLYIIKREDIKANINGSIHDAVEQEALLRRERKELKSNKFMVIKKTEADSLFYGHRAYNLNEKEFIEAGFLQQLLHFTGFPFNIQSLDSIFKNELQKRKMPYNYTLYYRDSAGVIIDQTADLSPRQQKKAFQTESLLIIDGNRVQALVVISIPYTFRNMFGSLIVSFLIFIILIFCIVYLTKTIFTQDKLDKLKSDFTHSFIHNIKSPLGSLKTILLKFITGGFENYPQKKEKFGKIAMKQIEDMLHLSDQILTVARLEKGHSVLNRSLTDVSEMIEELKEKFSVSNEKSVTIRTSVAINKEKRIFIDKLLIKEAVSNLLDNSIKYSGDSVKIIIDCQTIDNTLQIRVLDNGFGISAKDQQSIFDKFERGAAVERKEAKGFGLGLNFVKRVTEAHKGIVTLFSQVGEGSEFTLLLPILPL